MEERIVRFVASLRAGGVRISLAESTDAFLAIDRLGIKDRDQFRMSLRATLVKDVRSIPIYEELFPIFFGSDNTQLVPDIGSTLSADEAHMMAEALKDFNHKLRKMIEKLSRGETLSKEEFERLAKMVGLNHVNDLRYREWMVERLKRAMHLKQMQEALKELAELLQKLGMNRERVEQLQYLLHSNQQAIESRLRQLAGQRIVENMRQNPPDEDLESLLNRPFSSLSDAELDRLRREVQRLAAALKTRIALRQKRARSGQLDAKATLRANLKHAGVPIDLKHRQHSLKPKLVIICDLSTSMRSCSELMLSLIYNLQDQISKTHSFVFIDHLEHISGDFVGKTDAEAMDTILRRMPSGYYNTDLGNSLRDFYRGYLDMMDRRTTFIIVGDGRNNYNNPRIEMFTNLARRSRRTIWLTPEPPILWGTGDSDILKYAPACDIILQAGNLAELSAAVDRLLLS